MFLNVCSVVFCAGMYVFVVLFVLIVVVPSPLVLCVLFVVFVMLLLFRSLCVLFVCGSCVFFVIVWLVSLSRFFLCMLFFRGYYSLVVLLCVY